MRRMMSEWVSEPMSKSHVCVRVWNSPCTCYHFAVVPDVVVVIVWPIGANHNTAIATMSSTTKTVDDDARATRWETEDKEKMGSWSQSHKFRFGMEWRSWGEILKSVSLQFEYISYEQNPFIKYCLKFMLTIILSISQCIGTIKFNCKRNRRNCIEL